MKFLITGTGRCGTAYVARLFQKNGYKVGHQAVFRHEHSLGRPYVWGNYQGDCSFEAVPMLSDMSIHIKIILVKRDKQKVVDSWLRLGAFKDTMREDYLLWSIVLDRDFPWVLRKKTPEARAAEYYRVWNGEAERWADEVFDIETLDPHDLFAVVGRKYKPVSVPENYNH